MAATLISSPPGLTRRSASARRTVPHDPPTGGRRVTAGSSPAVTIGAGVAPSGGFALFRRAAAIAGLACLLAAPGLAAPTDEDFARLNRSVALDHIAPRYAKFAEETGKLDQAGQALCRQPDQARLGQARSAYVAGFGAWEAIQHVGFGPVELFFRYQRTAFWPDPRDVLGRQLGQALAKRDPESITPQAFVQGSVAIQGFTALERLLYGDDALAKLTAKDDAAKFRCAMLTAVTANIASIAADTAAAWGPQGFPAEMARAGQVGSRYMGPTDATLELIKSLHAAVELPIDRKLKRPLGPAADKAQLRTLEAWRSGQTLVALKANLAAAEALYLRDGNPTFDQLLSGPAGRADLAAAIRKQFAAVQQAVTRLRDPLDQTLAKTDQRQAALRVVEQGEKLKRMIAEDLTEALGVPLGFNSLDGD